MDDVFGTHRGAARLVTREAESRELEDFAVHKIAAPESPWPKNQQAPQYKTLTVELIVGTN
jgi:hypothetical protein